MNRRIKIATITTVSICLYAYLAHRMTNFGQWEEFEILITTNIGKILTVLAIQLILLMINILLESIKWRHIISPIQNIAIKDSVKSTLMAMALGNITPARTGEHIGRIITTNTHKRTLSAVLSLFSSIVQTAVITGVFVLSLPFATSKVLSIADIAFSSKTMLIILIFAIVLAATTIALTLSKRTRRTLIRLRILVKHHIATPHYRNKTIILSILRYTVFATQLAIALWMFGNNASMVGIAVLLPAYFFAITVIPSFFVADLAIKGSVALFIFGATSISESGILAATFAIWLINSALPTVVGHIIFAKNHNNSK